MVHVLVSFGLVVLLVIASACNRSGAPKADETSAPAAPAAAPEPPKPVPAVIPDVIARVNGDTVTKAEFEQAVAAIEQQNQGPVPPDQRDRILRGVLDQLVANKLLAQEAGARKIAVPDGDVDAQIAKMRQQFPSEDVFNQALKQQNQTVEKLKADVRSGMAIQKMLEETVSSKATVTPQQTKDFYDKNPDQFKRPEQVRASHILITVAQDADVAAKAAARRKAEGLLKQVKAGGDFAALAKANSQDPGSAVNGGDLGLFQRGQMVPPFDQAAFTLPPGSTSELVETQFGYHIIRVIEKQEAGTVALDEVRPRLEQYLQNLNRQREMQSFVDTLKAKGKVQILIQPVAVMRLDAWLDVACLFKTRSEAKRECESGHVDVNGDRAKPHRTVHEGDRLRINRGLGRHQDVVVRMLIEQHVKKAEARVLYDDVTPQPTAEEREQRRLERIYRAATRAAGTPDRRRRRALRAAKEGD